MAFVQVQLVLMYDICLSSLYNFDQLIQCWWLHKLQGNPMTHRRLWVIPTKIYYLGFILAKSSISYQFGWSRWWSGCWRPGMSRLIIALVRSEEIVRTSLFQAKAVLLSLHFFKKIQIDDEIKMNFWQLVLSFINSMMTKLMISPSKWASTYCSVQPKNRTAPWHQTGISESEIPVGRPWNRWTGIFFIILDPVDSSEKDFSIPIAQFAVLILSIQEKFQNEQWIGGNV